MKSIIYQKILIPALARYGTALGGYIVGALAVDASMVERVTSVVVAAGLIAVDLAVAVYQQRRERRALLSEVLGPEYGEK